MGCKDAKLVVEKAHPEWEKTVKMGRFLRWHRRQTQGILELCRSENSEDAIAVLDKYEGDKKRGSA